MLVSQPRTSVIPSKKAPAALSTPEKKTFAGGWASSETAMLCGFSSLPGEGGELPTFQTIAEERLQRKPYHESLQRVNEGCFSNETHQEMYGT